MSRRLSAQLVRRSDRAEVIAHLSRSSLANLLLLDMAWRLGSRPAPGEMRTELAVARCDGRIVGVVGLRPSVVLDASIEPDAIEALMPHLETLGVGLVKSPAPAVDRLWESLGRRAPRRAVIDRYENAYVLRPEQFRPAAGGAHPTRVRLAGPGDLEPLVVAARESLREEGRPDPFAGDVRSFRQWVKGRVVRARVVESAGRVVFVGYADVQRAEGWLLQGVYTWPDARGRGFATEGVSELCREAFTAGADHVQLAVVEGNAAGERLYENLGFKPFARLRTILFTDA